MKKRMFDIVVALVASLVFVMPFIAIMLAVKASSKGPIFFWSLRVGQYNKLFMMPKFRTMRVETPEVATDLLRNPNQYLTAVGHFLRKTSLDELPQLISVFNGDMSIVGPRPALHNQLDLIEARRANGIEVLLPGITGWAQVNGRDKIDINKKVKLDSEYLGNQSTYLDIKIIGLTLLAVLGAKGISH